MSDPSPAPIASPHRKRWLIAIMVLIFAYWLNGFWAASTKSATFDETVHTLSSWLIVNKGDFRVNPEHPPLWKYIAGLGLIGQPLKMDWDSAESKVTLNILDNQWKLMQRVMYQDLPPGKSPLYGEELVQRARVGNSVFMLLLGGVMAWWAWSWSGPLAATITLSVLMLEPNFLAHGPLVTNDVANSCAIAFATFLTWRLGEKFTVGRALAWIASIALAMEVKFTCLLLAPMLGVPLLYRACAARPWQSIDAPAAIRRFRRFATLAALCVVTVIAVIGAMWAIYHFRSSPLPDGERFNDEYVERQTRYYGLMADGNRHGVKAISQEALLQYMHVFKPGLVTRFFLAIENQPLFGVANLRLLPQAWIYGFNYASARSQVRLAYLMGQYSTLGFVWYFPLAIVFKTPVAELALFALTAIGGLQLVNRRWRDPAVKWKLVCLIVPPAIYMASAVLLSLNIGIRHILPVYVPMLVATGLTGARFIERWKPVRYLACGMILLLTIETLSMFPNYLSYFNFPSGGARGGLGLLGDSNLDWGQDLPALARWYQNWRKTDPTAPFHLCYFGTSLPSAYGMEYEDMQNGNASSNAFDPRGGAFAISATCLQGDVSSDLLPSIQKLRKTQPAAVLNGSIYVYVLPPTPATMPATGLAD